MGTLAGKSPSATYKSLLKVADETNGVSTSLSVVEDGEGTSTALSISDDSVIIKPQNDNLASTFEVKDNAGDRLLRVDTTNSTVKGGSTLTPLNTNILEFNAYRLVPVAGTHYFVAKGGAGNMHITVAGLQELANGTGTDPATSYNAEADTDQLVPYLFYVPVNLAIDSGVFMISTDTDNNTICNVHLYSFDMVNAGGTSDGDLSNGTLLANGQATAVDRNVIKTRTLSIDSANVDAGKVIACFVENETNTDDITMQVQLVYHFR
tara:strand:- start:2665 stop:3459 length:795 start_codon:yes stop_codon:yes gene_type:complete